MGNCEKHWRSSETECTLLNGIARAARKSWLETGLFPFDRRATTRRDALACGRDCRSVDCVASLKPP